MQKWTVRDRYNNTIYMTEERWQHILESRPELEPYFDLFLETLRTGKRERDPLQPEKFRYYKPFDVLLPLNTHLICIVIFRYQEDEVGASIPNNFVVTGWANYIWSKR